MTELLTAAAKTLNYETWSAEKLATGFTDTLGFTVELERLTRHVDDEIDEMSLAPAFVLVIADLWACAVAGYG